MSQKMGCMAGVLVTMSLLVAPAQLYAQETLVDLEGNARYAHGRAELGAGINVRITDTRLMSRSSTLGFAKPTTKDHLVSGYLQGDHWIVPNRIRVTIGSKIEYSSISGFAVEPSLRLLGHLNPRTTFWGAWSHAVRTPAMFERNATLTTRAGPIGEPFYSPIPVSINAAGSTGLRSGQLDAFEIGARLNIAVGFSLDMSAYHNRYHDLDGVAPTAITIMPPPTDVTGSTTNWLPTIRADYRILANTRVTSTGAEVAATAIVSDRVKFDLYGSFLDLHYWTEQSPALPDIAGLPRSFKDSLPVVPQPGLLTMPNFQGGVRSRIDLLPTLELNGWLRHVGPLKRAGIGAYTTLDARIGWHLNSRLMFAVSGRNLFDNGRVEFRDSFVTSAPTLVQRRFAAEIAARF